MPIIHIAVAPGGLQGWGPPLEAQAPAIQGSFGAGHQSVNASLAGGPRRRLSY
jgi:hypothetical protein